MVVALSLRMAHGSAAALRGVERSAALCALWRAMDPRVERSGFMGGLVTLPVGQFRICIYI